MFIYDSKIIIKVPKTKL